MVVPDGVSEVVEWVSTGSSEFVFAFLAGAGNDFDCSSGDVVLASDGRILIC